MSCAPADYVHELAAIANGTTPVTSDDVITSASAALGAFAAKPQCPFDVNVGPLPEHIVQTLHNQTIDEERHEKLLTAVYGLANTRHPDVIDKVENYTYHSVPALRVAALRAIGNVANKQATSKLVYHSLNNHDPAARRAGLNALQHHIHEDPTLATRKLVRAIFEPRVRRTPSELHALRAFFQKRVAAHNADYRIARVGINRLTLVQNAIENRPPLGSAIFAPIHWAKTFGGSNVRAAVGVAVDSDFDAAGAGFHAEAFTLGSLFSTNFNIASAGVYAVWDSSGLMSFSLWTAIFLYDFQLGHQVPYYLLNIQYMRRTVFQLMQGNPCTIVLPSSPAITIRETRSFIRATYYYGIPLIANVNLHVELVGWFEVGYGVQLVTRNITSPPVPGQITGYIRPGAGIGGQISAGIQVLVASAALHGNLDFASLYLPAGGAMVVNSLSPFKAGFGDSISLQGKFLQGQVRLCGGGCNYGWSYGLLAWHGVDLQPIYIDNRPNLCSTLISSADLPPSQVDLHTAITSSLGISPISASPPEGLTTLGDAEDSDSWCLCEGYYDPAAGLQWVKSTPGWGMNDYTYLSIGSQYMIPPVGVPPDMEYDCSATGYPDLCQNTNCWLAFSQYSSATLIFTYDDVVVNRRSKSMSALQSFSIPSGTHRDECPMNKCVEGGCCARVQTIPDRQNSRHGGKFCAFLASEFGVLGSPTRKVKDEFGIEFSEDPPSSKAICKATDFRYNGGSTFKQPYGPTCPGGCLLPLYALPPGQLPSFDYANMTLYLAGKEHPQLAFHFGDKIETHYQPLFDPNFQLIRYSRLQNLTVGHRILMIHGNITEDAGKYLDLVTPGGDIFQLLNTHKLLGLNETEHSLISVQMIAEFSHLVSHPKNLARQKQIESRAEVLFNVSDAHAVYRFLGSPGLFEAGKKEGQNPIINTPPHEETLQHDETHGWIGLKAFKSWKKLKSHFPSLVKNEL